jgi:hypothetical protein
MTRKIRGQAKQVTEWAYTSAQTYDDPFSEVELDVVMRHSDGDVWRVLAYWAGEREWRVRFAPPKPGSYEVTTICSNQTDVVLHSVTTSLEISPHQDDNPLLVHGSLRVSASKRTFEHDDGALPLAWRHVVDGTL